jgi:branched-subunit amino acid transport protein
MMAEWLMYLAVFGLVVLTAVTRAFFFLSEQPWVLPEGVVRGLKYAPLAALAAIIVPDLWFVQGQAPVDWQDARWVAAPVAAAWAWWRKDMLSTIVVGMAIFLALKLGMGW